MVRFHKGSGKVETDPVGERIATVTSFPRNDSGLCLPACGFYRFDFFHVIARQSSDRRGNPLPWGKDAASHGLWRNRETCRTGES